MLTSRLVRLAGTHAGALTQAVLKDFSFHRVPPPDLEARVFATYHNLGTWMDDRNDDAVRAEYERWGARRFRQGVPLAEAAYALILVKHHLRRLVRARDIVELSADVAVAEFFDRALYYLARGYAEEATCQDDPAGARSPSRRAGS